MDISKFFVSGDIKGAIAYMREHEEYKDILPSYVAIFENCEYRTYDVPEILNDILRLYQVYYRDIFYCGIPEEKAAEDLLAGLRAIVNMPEGNVGEIEEKLQSLTEGMGYQSLYGKTQGFYGPYIWKETVPTYYTVELPDTTTEYKVNILKGFVFRSYMDYLTFGRFGTGGWASPDGTINCIESAYDFNSERFLVSLLKHEAQHVVDMKLYKGILTEELEFRAKLVELTYSTDLKLYQKFLAEADDIRENDSHALASFRLKREFSNVDPNNIKAIQARALEVFRAHTKEMEEKYCK